jgi:hypothetical protein
MNAISLMWLKLRLVGVFRAEPRANERIQADLS